MRDKIIDILKRYSRDESVWESATDDSILIQDLKINSARIVDVVMDIEEVWEVTLDDDAVDEVVSLGELVSLVEKTVAAA